MAPVNNAVMNTRVAVQVSDFSSFRYSPRSGTAVSYGYYTFNVFKKPTYSFP